jgi:hypothetical protein
VTELTRLGWHFRQTEMNAPPKSVVQKRRGRPPNPCINSVISLRLDVIWSCRLSIGVAEPRRSTRTPPEKGPDYPVRAEDFSIQS